MVDGCDGKALTVGYLTLAAVHATSQVAEAVTRSPQRALMHGPTFMANPLACAVASASLTLVTDELQRRVREIGEELANTLLPAAEWESVRDVRVLSVSASCSSPRPTRRGRHGHPAASVLSRPE